MKTPIIFIQGPTATGKSELAVLLAQKYNGIIVNCDSVQSYKKVDIGSAKPSQEEQAGVEHCLFDFVSPPEELTAGKYRAYALDVIYKWNEKKRPLFFVGGSGFYFQALEKGMYDVEPISKEVEAYIEDIQKKQGAEGLHAELALRDKGAADTIPPQDLYRVVRALGLVLQNKKTMSEIEKESAEKGALKNPILKVGLWLERQQLEPIVTQRAAKMFNKGLVKEVEGLLSEGLENWAPLKSVGYKEVVSCLKGDFSLEECQAELIKNTLRLAKKQRTWFKRDLQIKWFNPIEEKDKKWCNATEYVNSWLESI